MGQDRPESSLGSRYTLLDEIGAGGMGTVWRARERDTGDVVAVKLLRDGLAGDPDLVLRFVQERNVMRALRHPGIVTVRDFVIEGDRLALVMDLVEGGDLRDLLRRRGTLPPGEAARLLAQVAAALAAAHAAGVAHRDVKPGNVLIEAGTGTARLTDFGVARIVHGPGLTQTSSIIGTPAYLAPEVAGGDSATPAVDVYALGLILYELLAGRPPFVGEHPMALLRQHASSMPRRLPGMPDVLWQVIAACVAKEPGARPEAAAVARALAEAAPSLAAHPALPPIPRTDSPSTTSEPLHPLPSAPEPLSASPTPEPLPPLLATSPTPEPLPPLLAPSSGPSASGVPGPPGLPHSPGSSGAMGVSGPAGPSGPQGAACVPGSSGLTGPHGGTGTSAPSGPTGPQRAAGPSGAAGLAGGSGLAGSPAAPGVGGEVTGVSGRRRGRRPLVVVAATVAALALTGVAVAVVAPWREPDPKGMADALSAFGSVPPPATTTAVTPDNGSMRALKTPAAPVRTPRTTTPATPAQRPTTEPPTKSVRTPRPVHSPPVTEDPVEDAEPPSRPDTSPQWKCRSWGRTADGVEMSPCVALVDGVFQLQGRVRGANAAGSDIHVQLYDTDAETNASEPFICTDVSPATAGGVATCGPFQVKAQSGGAKLDVRQRWRRTGTSTFGGGLESPWVLW
ncbi:protein kinase domain-containing protein [Nonomuraea bangladeshensis]|uniref:protein kinase domain-containing protein n=1 Tax=Nonomuraea bangladeshensis TaxID=404385 RepID=UPI003C2B2782